MIKSASAFIDAKGIAAVSEATGWSPGAVRVWKCRNRFPRSAWLELSQAYPELTLSVLRGLAPAKAYRVAAAP